MDHSRSTVAVVALAVAVRLAAALTLGASLHFIDEGIYLDAARRLWSGDGFGATYANVLGYPVILMALAGPWLRSLVFVRCAQAVVAGVATALVIELGSRTFGRRAAYIAALLYAFDPVMVVTAGLLYPETVAATLLLATLLAGWIGARRDRLLASAAAGILLGVVVQCRPVALVLLPVLTLWIAWAATASLGRRVGHAGVFALLCLVAVMPSVVRNLRVHGAIVPAGTTGLQSAPVPRAEIADRGLGASLMGRVADDPLGLARHVAGEFAHFWELYPTRLATDDPRRREALHRADPRLPLQPSFGIAVRDWVSALTFGAELALAIAGMAIAWRRRRVATVLFIAVILAYAFGFALFVAKLRYRLTVVPCMLLFAGVGAATLVGALPAAWRRRLRAL
jgi:hypothetical protein